MTVTGLASNGSLRSILAEKFTKLDWQEKIRILSYIIAELKRLHEQRICQRFS
jgi:hypothetical protein